MLHNHFGVLFKSTIQIYSNPTVMRLYEICVSSGITLVALLIPIAVGMYVRRRWPHLAKKILKVGILCNLLNVLCKEGLLNLTQIIFGNLIFDKFYVSAVHR